MRSVYFLLMIAASLSTVALVPAPAAAYTSPVVVQLEEKTDDSRFPAICGVNLGTCNSSSICGVNTASCTGGICGVNTYTCSGGICGANIKSCTGGICGVNLKSCSGGICVVNSGYCNGGICVVNTGTCKPGGICVVNTGTCGGPYTGGLKGFSLGRECTAHTAVALNSFETKYAYTQFNTAAVNGGETSCGPSHKVYTDSDSTAVAEGDSITFTRHAQTEKGFVTETTRLTFVDGGVFFEQEFRDERTQFPTWQASGFLASVYAS